ncbi:MAG: endonuclease/exonuclease/phosphatase family protein [Acidimicrobiia bacterium]|nr:endonuclease/exonuclease/phosphatase family protein [Acidimicrobiia bacterium]
MIDGSSSTDSDLVVGQGRYCASSPEPTGSIKVVSWNIQFGVEVEAAIELLSEHDQLRDPDVVLLQEMDEAGTNHIAQALGYDYVYGAPGVHQLSGRDFGNSVLARWPLGQPEVFRLPHRAAFRGQNRVLVTTYLSMGEERVLVGSVHTEVPSLSSPKRRRQFDEIAMAVGKWEGGRLLLGGDFNTMTSRGIRTLTDRLSVIGAARVSAASGPSLRRSGQEFTLDHIFARGWEPLAAGVVAGSGASDHRPVWVRLADPLG